MTDSEKQRLKQEEAVVDEVYKDFARRQEERRILERGWQLNMNFISGNQYCGVNLLGELENQEKGYFWQERRVFNHIAGIIDTRSSKLSGIRPKLAVRAASDEDDDRRAARLASAILNATYEDCDVDSAITAATVWSESCGTAFYKIVWDGSAGNEIGKTFEGASVREGKIKVMAVSPFEIYPDSLSEENLYAQPSLMHARAVPADDIYQAYGVRVEGRDIEEFALSPVSLPSNAHGGLGKSSRTVKHGYELVIERYVRPNYAFPEGRFTVVAGGKLLYDGEMPYINGDNKTRIYPFVKQCCMPLAGGFFGSSIVDRLIPVQRAYNAVKNRKHEFLNRISMGTVAVEEGSVDTDELTEDGLAPGKVIVYRQGGNPPEMLTMGSVPAEFTQEEERLEKEFAKISGTTDITQEANSFSGVTSATGLQIIIEQDEARLNVCYEQIKSALRLIGKMALRLYRQFASSLRLIRYTGKNDALSVLSFKGSDISGDDVVLEADNEINMSPARRRTALYDMIDRGLLSDESGKISPAVKNKLLETFGYNGFVGDRDMAQLHRTRCAEENEKLKQGKSADIKEYDDHAIHVSEHTAFLLTEKLTQEQEERVCAHLREHKKFLTEVHNER